MAQINENTSLLSNEISESGLNPNNSPSPNAPKNPSNQNYQNNPQGSYNYAINPELLTYISKVQSENNRFRHMSTNNDTQDKKVADSQYTGLNENIHIDTDKKSKARRSLLYLLNNLSGGTFCPEINGYFKELKESKKNEKMNNEQNKKNQNQQVPPGKLKDTLIKNPVSNMKNLKNQILANNTAQNDSVNQSSYAYKFKKRKEGDNSMLYNNNLYGNIKQFTDDYQMKDLENLYSIEELESGAMKFQYSKAAKAKLNLLKHEGKGNDPLKKKKNKKNKMMSKMNSIKSGMINNNNNNQLMVKKKTLESSMGNEIGVNMNNASNSSIFNNNNNSQIKFMKQRGNLRDINEIEEEEGHSSSSNK